ncbi:MAG: rhodanese-like domain-containing protein [Ilumatobacteraceae bacterium]
MHTDRPAPRHDDFAELTGLVPSPRHRRRLTPVIALVAALGLGAVACGSDGAPETTGSDPAAATATTGSAVTVIGPAEGKAMIDEQGDQLTIIDVRTPAEFADGHLADAVNLDVSGGEFEQLIAPLDHGATYVVYCRSGNRSAAAAKIMADAGFTSVFDLGGITAWQDAGYPVVTG